MALDRIVSSESVVNEVLQRLTQAIIEGQFRPGDQLPTESELGSQLGVSRNSIREAIKMLSAMGVASIRRGQGTYLADSVSPAVFNPLIFNLILEPKAAEHLYELRAMFESMVMMIAMKKMSEKDFSRVEQIIQKTEDLHSTGQGTLEDFVQADMDFHITILECTYNPLIEQVGRTIIALFPAYIREALQMEGMIAKSVQNHRRILQVLASKQAECVMEVVETTLMEWQSRLKKPDNKPCKTV